MKLVLSTLAVTLVHSSVGYVSLRNRVNEQGALNKDWEFPNPSVEGTQKTLITLSATSQDDVRIVSEESVASVEVTANRFNGTDLNVTASEIVMAEFDDKMVAEGWGHLKIQTYFHGDEDKKENKEKAHDLHYFAAGYAEGYLTAQHLYDHCQNMKGYFHDKTNLTEVYKWLTKQMNWMESQIKNHPKDPLWMHASQILAQTKGLYKGYQAAKLPGEAGEMSFIEVYAVNSVGDLLDLHVANSPDKRPDWTGMSENDFKYQKRIRDHCSALIRLTPDLSDIIVSHSSWFSYSSMNRIFKHYNFDLPTEKTAAAKVSFSSYPGMLSSLDDFYMMSSGLFLTQTTNNIFENKLFDLVKPESLLAWQRVRLACVMAKDGKEWADTVEKHNSGTYNNQYIVLDYNKFTPYKSLAPNALWIIEQIPGLVVKGDQTNILETSHWPSYNVPFYKEIYNKSGYPAIVKQKGLQHSYELAPRAEIFRRDAQTVTDMESMKKVMRYNDYRDDPLSKGDPANSICSRFDLEEKNPHNDGCYDTKVTNYENFKTMTAFAINGPTLGNGSLPVFEWQTDGVDAHYGLPKRFDYSFIPVHANWTN